MDSLIISALYSDAAADHTPHYHDCHQLIYIEEGEVEITIADTLYRAGSGSLILISHFEHHEIKICSSVYRRYILRISPHFTVQQPDNYLLFSPLFNRSTGFTHVLQVRDMETAFLPLFQQLAQEKRMQKPFSTMTCDLLLQMLLILLYRHFPELFSSVHQDNISIVQQIQNRFENEYRKSFSLTMLAKEYHISTYYLSHLFKSVAGYPLMKYLQACRIAAAKNYLTKTHMSIGEIVEACGFNDSSNFSRLFRRETGMSPSKFRQSYT